MIIPAKFGYRVLRHFVAASVRDRHPLILAIQGSPGSGKSFQLWNTLVRARITPVHNAAVALSGGYEGDSAAELKELVLKATRAREFTAIVINDLDLSNAGRVANTTYTVNSQILVGALMDYCDQPDLMRRPDGYRVPIFVTANNLNRLPKPVTRASRMDIYSWQPTSDEIADIVTRMCHDDGFLVKDRDLREYAHKNAWTVASYAAALSHLVAERLYSDQQKRGSLDLVSASRLIKNPSRQALSIDLLDSVLRSTDSPRDYLKEDGS